MEPVAGGSVQLVTGKTVSSLVVAQAAFHLRNGGALIWFQLKCAGAFSPAWLRFRWAQLLLTRKSSRCRAFPVAPIRK